MEDMLQTAVNVIKHAIETVFIVVMKKKSTHIWKSATKGKILETAKDEYKKQWYETECLVENCRKLINKLSKIALRSFTLLENEYIKL